MNKRSGNEPMLPQPQSNEPQIGGLRRIEKYQTQRKGNRMSYKIIRVAGTTFPAPDGTDRQAVLAELYGRANIPVRLQSEPDNKFDKNAIGVIVTMPDGTEAHAGYIPRTDAPGIAPYLDKVAVEIRQISGGFELNDGSGETANYGMELTVTLPEVAE